MVAPLGMTSCLVTMKPFPLLTLLLDTARGGQGAGWAARASRLIGGKVNAEKD